MPFPMKIQPIDSLVPSEGTRLELAKPVVKSRLKRLLERQFSGVLRNSAPEKISGGEEPHNGSSDFEPSSACLAKMVQNFIEESHEKHSVSHRNRCNCFNRNYDDSSDEESNSLGGFGDSNYSSSEACETVKVNCGLRGLCLEMKAFRVENNYETPFFLFWTGFGSLRERAGEGFAGGHCEDS